MNDQFIKEGGGESFEMGEEAHLLMKNLPPLGISGKRSGTEYVTAAELNNTNKETNDESNQIDN